MIHFSCPRCNAVLKAPKEKAGKKSNCPKCGQRMELPSLPSLQKTMLAPELMVDPASASPLPWAHPIQVENTKSQFTLGVPMGLPTQQATAEPNPFKQLESEPELSVAINPPFWRYISAIPYGVALLFFFLPWVSISCNVPNAMHMPNAEKVWVTQSGFQAIYGGYTVPIFLDVQIKNMQQVQAGAQRKPNDPLARFSPFMVIFGVVLLIALAVAFFIRPCRDKLTALTFITVLLITPLIVQGFLGYPVERSIRDSSLQQKTLQPQFQNPLFVQQQPLVDLQSGIIAASLLDVRYTLWFWLEIVIIMSAPVVVWGVSIKFTLPKLPGLNLPRP